MSEYQKEKLEEWFGDYARREYSEQEHIEGYLEYMFNQIMKAYGCFHAYELYKEAIELEYQE